MTLKEFAEAILQLPEEDQGRVLVTEDFDREDVYTEVFICNDYIGPHGLIGLENAGLEKYDNTEYYALLPKGSADNYEKVSGKVAVLYA